MRKVYVAFMQDPDTNTFTQFVGVFDSREAYRKALASIEEELGVGLDKVSDINILETELNKNWIADAVQYA
jgi:hypothetical protein